MLEIILQILEYAGIPIGLMLFTIMGNKLISADPISKDKHDSLWGRGLELMQIICVSTTLFGLSFFAHKDGEQLSTAKLTVIIIALIFTIIEFIVIMVMIINAREWGIESEQTKRTTNLVALMFWIALVGLISISYSYLHPPGQKITITNSMARSDSIVHTRENSQHRDQLVAFQPKINIEQKLSASLVGRKMLATVAVIVFVAFVLLSIWLIRNRQTRRRRKILDNYSQALILSGANDPGRAIEKLNVTLKRTPTDSALIIDVYMKLARIYRALKDENNALNQVNLAQETQAYTEFSYLRDAVLNFKVGILLDLKRFSEAEKAIDEITSESTSSKLKVMLVNARKVADDGKTGGD